MTFSFISPNRKILFSSTTRSWLLCFFCSFLSLMFVWKILDFQANRFEQRSQEIQKNIIQKQDAQNIFLQQLNFLNSQLQALQDTQKENRSLTTAVKNLLDLIPEQITIHSIALTDQALTIKGITPSKELYTFLLETPLKAIFLESKVDFFVLPSGWYNFVSVNKIDPNTQGENND